MAEIVLSPQPVQKKFLEAEQRIVFFGGGAGGGKALRNDQRVLTPNGWTEISNLSVDDEIICPDNTTSTISGVFPQGIVETFLVEFQDGRKVVACKDHLWSVWLPKKGGKNQVLTTEQLLSLYSETNVLVPLCQELDFGNNNTPLDPYCLGIILGDGNISQKHCCITTMDTDIVERISNHYEINKWNNSNSGRASTYGISGVVPILRKMGLMNTKSDSKFIPKEYLDSSLSTRKELLQGLLDSDGYISKDGKIYFYSKSLELCKGVQYIVRSLGGRATISEKYTKYNGNKVLSYNVYINIRDSRDIFFTKRKKERARSKTGVEGNRITNISYLGKEECTCISINHPDKLFITEDFIVTHNTWSILADNLQGVHDPHYYSVFFRTTTVEIDDGLWPEAKMMYAPLLKDENDKYIGKAKVDEQKKTITFPSGARTKFAYLELNKHADAYYGAEITKIYFDEFQFRNEYQFEVLRSRNRSRAKVQKGIRCTLNPDPDHFVYDWIKPFIDDEGFPLKEYSGRTRYYLIFAGELYTSWDYDELYEKFYDPKLPEKQQQIPDTYTYIPATLEDNEILMNIDPSYRAVLNSLSPKKRKQLLQGCWARDEDAAMYFNRAWLHKASHVPLGARFARGWDTASEVPNETNKFPDFTAGIKMAKTADGYYYICGGRSFQKRPGDRDNQIKKIAKEDGVDCTVVSAIDPGAAGKTAFQQFAAKMTSAGFKCRPDPMPNNKSKVTRFEPFSVACENGLVYIVESTFEPEELKKFYDECEKFDGERSTARRKDDYPDAAATTFNYLCKETVVDCDGLATALTKNSETMPNVFKNVSSIYGITNRR